MAQTANRSTIEPAAKDLARDMYLSGKTQTTIANQLGVHPKTISYWIKQNNWQEVKSILHLSPLLIRANLFAQLEALTDHILTRDKGNNFPDTKEANIQNKLVQAIFKFPHYTLEHVQAICRDLSKTSGLGSTPKSPQIKNEIPADKKIVKSNDNQLVDASEVDKEGIKMDKESEVENSAEESENAGYIPRKNVVLRSGVRWIEKGIAFDPKTRQNRRLMWGEYEELLKKGLTKADFQGWHPAN